MFQLKEKKQTEVLAIACNPFMRALLIKDADLLGVRLNRLINEIVESGIAGRFSKTAFLKLPKPYYELLFVEEASLALEFLPRQDIIKKLAHLENSQAVGLMQSYLKRYLSQALISEEAKSGLLRKHADQMVKVLA